MDGLTDYRIWELILLPAVRRNRDRNADRQRKAFRGGGGLPDRAAYIAIGRKLGIPAEHSAAEYDRWEAGGKK